MKKVFLVVWETEYNNKESYTTTKIGTTIKTILADNGIFIENSLNYERLDSDNPYDVGAFSVGFYDIYVYYKQEGKDYGEDNELTDEDHDNPAGRIMIFEVGEPDEN
jgi:hypothetical protein